MAVLPYLVALIGVLIVIGSGLAVAIPGFVRDRFTLFQDDRFLMAGIGGRLAVGVTFLVASQTCSWPLAIGTIGVLSIIEGLFGVFGGLERVKKMIAWFLRQPDTMVRSWAAAGAALGVFIVYAAL